MNNAFVNPSSSIEIANNMAIGLCEKAFRKQLKFKWNLGNTYMTLQVRNRGLAISLKQRLTPFRKSQLPQKMMPIPKPNEAARQAIV
jgi:hypothetical protein